MSQFLFRPAASSPLSRRPGRSGLLIGTATLAIALTSAPARAECTPVQGGGMICTGVTADYVSDVEGQVTTVAAGATVGGGGAAGDPAIRYDAAGSLLVEGAVASPLGIGVLTEGGGAYRITVGQAGSISGRRGIISGSGPDYRAHSIDNAGRIEGTQGPAIAIGDNDQPATIVNRASGRILGGIEGSLNSLSNDGLIDGGEGSAISSDFVRLANRGRITSAAADAATIETASGYADIENSGMIEATGSGAAINAGALDLVNGAGATIRAADMAIVADGGAGRGSAIENAGAIIGHVQMNDATDDSFYQRVGGTVTGNVSLGAGDDSYYLEQHGATLANGAGGTIDGGTGTDILGVRVRQSGTVAFGALPAGFERHGVDLCGCDVIATIAAASYGAPLTVTGEGTLVNLADFTVTGDDPILTFGAREDDDGDADFGLRFINRGTITAQNNGDVVVTTASGDGYVAQFLNEGTIAMSGGYGVGLDIAAYGFALDGHGSGFDNRGVISGNSSRADAVTLSLNGVGRNSGSITADGAGNRAVVVGYYGEMENEAPGRITADGAAVTLANAARLRNAGRIESANGEGILISGAFGFGSNQIVNRAGGTIKGAAGSIREEGASGSNVLIANQGELIGDVDLTAGTVGDVFWASQGSSVAGDVRLGDGDDLFIADISRVNSAGVLDTSGIISGALDTGAGVDTLMLQAAATGAASIVDADVTGFEGGIIYEAKGEDTVLTLGGPLNPDGSHRSYSKDVRLAGDGTIVLDSDVDVGGKSLVALTVADRSTATLFGEGEGRLNLIIDSNIAGGDADRTVDAAAAGRVELSGGNAGISSTTGTALLTGEGTEVELKAQSRIRLARVTQPHQQIGIEAHGSDIVNTGEIVEDGEGSADAPDADSVSTGVLLDGGSYRNLRQDDGRHGAINVAGTGIDTSNGALILNDGRIESRYGDAIRASNAIIVNGAAGEIVGHSEGNVIGIAGAAIVGSGGDEVVENAGTITGDVVLLSGRDTYVATGGSVAGNVDLGDGDDSFLVRAGLAPNVGGTISGGDGIDAYGTSFVASAALDLAGNVIPAGFELHGVEALNADTEVTTSSASTQAEGMRLFGDGKVVNTANFDVTGLEGQYSAIEVRTRDGVSRLDLENRGTITTDIVGIAGEAIGSFVNSGTITATRGAFDGYSEFGATSFTNSATGRMTTSGDGRSTVRMEVNGFDIDGAGDGVDFVNAGTIDSTGVEGRAVSLSAYYGEARVNNSGTVRASGTDGIGLDLFADFGAIAKVGNSGTIEASGVGGRAVVLRSGTGGASIDPEDCIDGTPQGSIVASLDNSGIIRANGGGDGESGGLGAVAVLANVEGANGIIRVNNLAGGVIEATGLRSTAIAGVNSSDGYGGVDLETALFEIENAGTIRGGGDTITEDGVIAGAIQTFETTDTVTNLATGQIIGNVDLGAGNDVFANYGSLQGDVRLGEGDDQYIHAVASSFSGTAYGGDGLDTLTVDLQGTGSVNFDQFRGFERLTQRGAGTVAIRGSTDLATLTIAGSNISILAGTSFSATGEVALAGADATETLTIAGTLDGSVDFGGGADVLTLSSGGLVQGDVQMGAGDDRVNLNGGTATGTIDGGAGIDTIAFQIAGNVSALPDVINFESLDVTGEGRLTLAMNQDFDTISLNGGADLTLDPGEGGYHVGNIIGDDSAQDVVLNVPLTGGVSLGGGNDSLALSLAGTLSGGLDGGAGTDILNLTLTDAATINGGLTNFETVNVGGTSPLTLGGTIAAGQSVNFDGLDNSLIIDGASVLGVVDGGAGRDQLTFVTDAGQTSMLSGGTIRNFEDLVAAGAGTLSIAGTAGYQTITVNGGNLSLAENASLASGATTFDGADNVFTMNAGAIALGPIDGGAGTDRLVLNQGVNESRSLGSVNFTGFEELESGGPGELHIDTNAAFEVVDLLGGKMTIVNGATLTVPTLNGGAGANILDVRGTLAGNVDLGAGDDRLTIATLNAVTGTRSGGAGVDTLDFSTGGTNAAPVAWNGTGFDSFEKLNVSAGVLSLTGDASFQNVAITGGRLIGQAGTTISATDTIIVHQGATFGSAGTVKANIDVRGVLSPGGSPGTMTVQGDVAFAAGSSLLLEVSPSGNDLLNISGKLTVAPGAAIDVTGLLNTAPGGALDLVVANGGIAGGFSTINKSDTVFGFVAQRGNKIQLIGEFQNDTAYGTNAQASIAYANAVLGSGRKVQDFTGALPVLVDSFGRSNQSAFAQLTPEGFGSATQIGIDNGLMIADTVRSLRYAVPQAGGFFSFGQALHHSNDMKGGRQTGAAASSSNGQGLLGGLGFAAENGTRIGAFVGTLSTDQSLAGLGVSTKTQGVSFGAFADVAVGGFGLHALLAYDASDARTTRRLAAGDDSIKTRYDLGGLVFDLSVDSRFDLGRIAITPHVATTYVEAKRDGVTEAGSPFALAVEGASGKAWFADAGITLATQTQLGSLGFQPYVEASVRHLIRGGSSAASGGFVDAGGLDAVTVSGVGRDRTFARLGAGFGLDLNKGVRVNVGYGAEIGSKVRQNLNAGLAISF
jgi:hypothetical protein